MESKTNHKKPPNISAFELTQARALVEGEAAALAATTISEEELERLKKTLDEMEKGINADAADKEFHLVISTATRNAAILMAIDSLWRVRESSPAVKLAYKGVCSQSDALRLDEHTAIYNALKKHDSQAARAAMHRHFNRLINALFEASEAKALEEMRRQTNQTRDLYSLNHLIS